MSEAFVIGKELLMAIFTLLRLGFSLADMEGKTPDEIMAMAEEEERKSEELQQRQEQG